jgi:sulfur carrier protein ThiS adenylyltransferase
MNTFEQGLLTYLNEDQLKKIRSVKIGIGGAGGLGSNCAMILVRCGFSRMEILDQDVIDASNLNRQQYYLAELGKPKVVVTRQRLLDINPNLEIIVHQTTWTPANGHEFFLDCDFIVEAFDQADFKFKFVEFYQDKVKLVVSGNGMAGLTEKKPMVRRRLGNIIMVGDGNTDSAAGHPPMAPRVTQCAAMMAEVILDETLEVR